MGPSKISCVSNNRQAGKSPSQEDPVGTDRLGGLKSLENDLCQRLQLENKQGSMLDSEVYFDSSSSCKDWSEAKDHISVDDGIEGWNDALDDKDGWSDIEETDDKWNDDAVEIENEWNGWEEEFDDDDDKVYTSHNREKDELVNYDNSFTMRNTAFRGKSGFAKLPLRPEADDCSFYMKTGWCKFGSGCKFNHPLRRKLQEGKDPVENQSQIECKYYHRAGGCKYGDSCKFIHLRENPSCSQLKAVSSQIVEYNLLGYPIRVGESDCPHYMRNGSCKFAANCRFNHPTSVVSEFISPRSALSSSWLFKAAQDSTPYFPITPKPSNPTGFQASGYPQLVSSEVKPLQFTEFPERSGQPDCNHYVKTGECKYKANCKYNHPKNRSAKVSDCALSVTGLPLRPDKRVCDYYNRYGICKFGPACNFDHPVSPPASTNREQSFLCSGSTGPKVGNAIEGAC